MTLSLQNTASATLQAFSITDCRGKSMDFSSDLIARILYCIPFSPAKLAMQGVSKRFRQAMQTRQAHAASAKVTFPLEESHSPCIPRSILKVLPYVSLGSRQTDLSWVAFLDHLQVLACRSSIAAHVLMGTCYWGLTKLMFAV